MSRAASSTKAVVIGSSGGIGSALVRALGARGVGTIHALSRSGAAADASGGVAGAIDLRDEASVAAAAARVGAAGNIHLVIVATGLLHGPNLRPEKTYGSLGPQDLAEYFAVNAIGPALAAKHFLPLLPRRERAVFACLSARVGSIGDNRLGGWYGYRASKAALNMLIKTLSIELARTAPHAICVALHPGTVDTALSAPFRQGVAPEKLFTPDFSANKLLDLLENLTPAQSGGCFGWDGAPIAP